MKSKIPALIFFAGLGLASTSNAAITKLTDYVYDCEKPSPSKQRILSVPADLYLDVFWQLFNDLKELDYSRESVGVTPEQSQCVGNMKALMAQLYRQAPSSASKHPQFYLRMGQYQAFNAQYKLAQQSFKNAVDLNPGSITANVEMSRILERRNKKKEQEKYLRMAVAVKPKTDEEKDMVAEAYNKLVEAFEPDSKKAAELVNRWLVLEPKSLNARTAQADLGLELADSKMVDEATKYLLSPDKEYYAAHAAFLRKDYHEAAKAFRIYLARDDREQENDLLNTRYYIHSLFNNGDKAVARREAEAALNKWATDDKLIAIHEKIVIEGGVLDDGDPIKDLEEAASKNPRSRAIKYHIVELLLKGLPLKVEDADPLVLRTASAYVDKMLEQNPEDVEALYRKAFVRYQSRSFTDADITMSRVIDKVKDKRGRKDLVVPIKNVFTVAANIKEALGYTDEAGALRRQLAMITGEKMPASKTTKSLPAPRTGRKAHK